MKRRLSSITFGMMALLFMFASPVSAQKSLSKQIGKNVNMSRVKTQKLDGKIIPFTGKKAKSQILFDSRPADKGLLRQKNYSLNDAMKFSDYSNMLKTKKFFKNVGNPNRVAKVNMDNEPITPPINEVWDSTYVDQYTTVDTNGDGASWFINAEYNYAFYSYNSLNAADDWLLSPYLQLEAGKLYDFKALLSCAASSYAERIEILYGQGDDPTTYSDYLLEDTEITHTDTVGYTAQIVPAEDGVYRIAFHAISDADKYRLYVDGWSLSGARALNGPQAVTDVTVTPAELGALNAIVSFTAPTLSINGEALESITKIDVISNNEVLATVDNPEPGSSQSVTVVVPESGAYVFNIIAYNESGAGVVATASAYIGNDKPSYVDNVEGIDNKDGTITYYWDKYAEETGVNGGYLDLSTLSYNIYGVTEDGDLGDLIANVTDTTYVISYPEWNEGDMDFHKIVVAPVVSGIEGGYSVGGIIVGQPDELPYNESFADVDGALSHFIWTSTIYNNSWGLSSTSVDGDDASALFTADTYGAAGALNTGKISLKGVENPYMSFNFALLSGDYGSDIDFYVCVDLQDGNGYIPIYYVNGEDVETSVWLSAILDLSDFVNQEYVIISFLAQGSDINSAAYLDNIQIMDLSEPDLAIEIGAPGSAYVGDELEIDALVSNNSVAEVLPGEYSVVFSVNGEEIATVQGTDTIQPVVGRAICSTTYPVALFDQKSGLALKAELVYGSDTDDTNNVDETNVLVNAPNLPVITDLAATQEGANVNLVWSAYDKGDTYAKTVEDFENGQGGFTCVDSDGDGFNWYWESGYATNSGQSSMISHSYYNNYGALTPDNWLISPEVKLIDEFSFYACGQDPSWCEENFAVYVSTNGMEDLSQFVQVSEEFVATGQMKKYTVDLSQFEGKTGYVAIRHFNVTDQYILVVDDISYVKTDANVLSLTGYNVYRDGELIGEVAAGTNEFVDESVAAGTYTYNVTNVFGELESGLSNDAEIEVTYLMGDVNHDGVVDINDINAVVGNILGNVPDVFYPENADMDADGVIGVNDIPFIVNIILGIDGSGDDVALAARKALLEKIFMTLEEGGYEITNDVKEQIMNAK